MRTALLIALLGLTPVVAGGAVITFTDISASAEVNLTSRHGKNSQMVDFDLDSDLDIMVWNSGERDDQLYMNTVSQEFPNVAQDVGINGLWGIVGEDGGPFHDFNHDGMPDVYVPTIAGTPNIIPNLFYHNLDGSSFQESGQVLGLRDPIDRFGPVWADYNLDGFLDIYVGILPRPGFENRPALYCNRNSTLLTDEWVGSGLTFFDSGKFHLWFDWEEDGDPDLYIGASRTASPEESRDRLFQNDGWGNFTDVTSAIQPTSEWTSDVELADFNADGLLDLFILNETEDNRVWADQGDGTFDEIASLLGLDMENTLDPNDIRTGSIVADFDNDMDPDVFVVLLNSFLGQQPPYQLWLNENGTFVERGFEAGVDHEDNSTVCTTGDLNGDGFLDIFVANETNFGAPDVLFLNDGNSNHWLEIDPVGTNSNRDAVGLRAWVTAGGKTQVQELYSTTSLPGLLHFGLASNEVVEEVQLRWPSGLVETYADVAADQIFRPVEGDTIPWNGMGVLVRGRPGQ